jgi:hypothetical protein
MFSEELDFFKSHQDELVREHEGKVLVIKGQSVIGVYPDVLVAYLEAQKEHSIGTFMLQPCEAGPEAYTVTISSTRLTGQYGSEE